MGLLMIPDERVIYDNKICELEDKIDSLMHDLCYYKDIYYKQKDDYDYLLQQNQGYQRERKILISMIEDKNKELELKDPDYSLQMRFSRLLIARYLRQIENLELQVNTLIGHCKNY